MKIAFFMAKSLELLLYFLVLLLFLRQILPLTAKRITKAEGVIVRLTEPLLFGSDCFCRMTGFIPQKGGIDPRYPMAIGILTFAAKAISGFGLYGSVL